MKDKPIKELLDFSIINIDKPLGPTSFSVTNFICKSLSLNKCAHMGTLDPTIVSGVLPITLGRACRLNETFMHRDKEYVGIMRIHQDVSLDILKEKINNFIGKITQLPPVRSRVKRAPREREVKSFEILEKKGKDILFKTKVQAGTYIRKLIHDIGLQIGGAHMLELRRVQTGIFSEENIVNLYDFESAILEYKNGNEKPLRNILIPAESAILKVLPRIDVSEGSVKKLLDGKPLMKSDLQAPIKEPKFGFH